MKYPTTAMRLRVAMRAKDIKANELASKADVHKSSISQYVNGSHTPSNITAGRMGEVLGVNPLWLMGFDVPMFVPEKEDGEMGQGAEIMSIYIRELEQYVSRLDEENVKRLLTYAERLYDVQVLEKEFS